MSYRLLRALLFRFDPEQVHEWAVQASQLLNFLPALVVDDPVTLAGVRFPNRIGLAAGFDKKARFVRAAETLGFGHIEVGAITPLPQVGHPRPRLFRVPPDSLCNRMGFNNDGMHAVVQRLPLVRRRIVVGLNLGKGSATPMDQAVSDYLAVLRHSYGKADYFSVNISSPNTADLRELGRGQALWKFCQDLNSGNRLEAQRQGLARRSLWLKVSPDESDDQLKALASCARECQIDGLIATNTTVTREGAFRGVDPLGGLSGLALRERSPRVVALLRSEVGAGFPIIGVGGVHDGPSALAMRQAGADLVQLYTGFVYGGPLLPFRLARALKRGM